MKKRRIVSTLLAFAITAGLVENAYAQNTELTVTTDSRQLVLEETLKQEPKIVRTAISEHNLPDTINAKKIVEEGYVARLNSEEQSLSEIVLEKDDGTRALYLFSENIKYIDDNGEIADKSNTAVNRGKAYVNEGNDIEVILPATITAGIVVNSDELNITMKPVISNYGRLLSPAVKTEDDTVKYNDVFDSSTDVEYTYTYSGVKENIILESYNGKNSFDYELTTGGLSLHEDKGVLLLSDESGEVKATLGEVIVFSADNKNNTFGKYTIQELEKNNRYRVTISVDRDYLTDSETKYPVKIDPTINSVNNNVSIQDMQVFKGTDGSGTSETSAGYSGVSRVGWSDWGACRTLLKLNNFNFNTYKISNTWQIESAYVEIRDLMCQGGSGVPISCGQFKGNFWTENDARTWNGLDAGNSSLSAPVNVTYGKGNSTRDIDDKNQWYRWNITSCVKKWVTNASLKEKGLQFRMYNAFFEEQSTYAQYMKTFSSMQGNPNYKPYIEIKYVHKGSLLYGIENADYNCSKPVLGTQSVLSKYSYNNTVKRMVSVNATDVVNELENNKNNNVFLFFSHGYYYNNVSGMSTGTNDRLLPNSFNNTEDLSHVKVALLVGCNTTKSDNNVPSKMVSLGAKYALGFDTNIYSIQAEEFVIDFFDYYANDGYTAQGAAAKASEKLTLPTGSSYKDGKHVMYTEYGNLNQKFIN